MVSPAPPKDTLGGKIQELSPLHQSTTRDSRAFLSSALFDSPSIPFPSISSFDNHVHADLQTTAGEVHSIVEDLIQTRRTMSRRSDEADISDSAIKTVSRLGNECNPGSKYFNLLSDSGNQLQNALRPVPDSETDECFLSESTDDTGTDAVVRQLREILSFKDRVRM
eukprot:m.144199 g.144199  ORF g.144199 m.144199 type:complete len:167 (-) comp17705_c0_seq1:561-1061(-)